MVLHLLYGQKQLQDCLALVSADDTLLVIDAGLLEVAGESLRDLECKVMLLEDAESQSADHGGLPVIDTTGWLELVSQHPHSMSWA